jgi:hypothetical protein
MVGEGNTLVFTKKRITVCGVEKKFPADVDNAAVIVRPTGSAAIV